MRKKLIVPLVSLLLILGITACSGSLKIEMPKLLEETSDESIENVGQNESPDNITKEEELPSPPPPPEPLNLENLAGLQEAYINIYEKVLPSVVSISSTRMITQSNFDFPEGDFEFDFGFELPEEDEPFEYPESAAGSGFVWDTEGHIITNNHVIEGGDVIRVDFSNGRSEIAELIGADADSDLAVLKVDVPAEELIPISVSDSTQVKVGQIAVAIGNPFQLESSMTTGIVSGVGRSLPVSSNDGTGLYYSIPDIIQTDTAINPGNSGGVLVDINGGLIGVTTAIESPVRANSGVGYVIPSVIVQKIVPLLIRDGRYEQPWIGISGQDFTPEYARLMDLDPQQSGVLVQTITPNSPAEDAGLLGSSEDGKIDGYEVNYGGDVIIKADDDEINDFEDLVAFLARRTIVGQTITLTLIRDGEVQTVDLTLEARPNSEPVAIDEPSPQPREASNDAWLGISGVTLMAEINEEMDLPEDTTGVLIQSVTNGSPADDTGLRGSYKSVEINGQEMLVGGDIITKVDNQSIDGMDTLIETISGYDPGDQIVVTILRDGLTVRLDLTLGAYPD